MKVKVRKIQRCQCWKKGHWWIEGMDTCIGTREQDPCTCKGDTRKCDYYPEKRNLPALNTMKTERK